MQRTDKQAAVSQSKCRKGNRTLVPKCSGSDSSDTSDTLACQEGPVWEKNYQTTRNDWGKVEIARTFYMLYGNMQANLLQNMENSGSIHGNTLQNYNAASTIWIKTENGTHC